MLEKATLHFITLSRNLFLNTPFAQTKAAGRIKTWIFRLAFHSKDKEIVYRDFKMIVPTTDASLVPGLIGGYYEQTEVDIFRSLVKEPGTVILDIGANIGLYSLLALQYGGKDTKIYAFEPVPQNIKYLKENVRLNGKNGTSITINESAVGAEDGVLSINLSPVSIGTHSAVEVDDSKTSIEVPVTAIDSFVAKRRTKVDIIKIDVEGYEGFVLRGAQKTIGKYTPTIFIEHLPRLLSRSQFSFEEMHSLLFDHYKNCFVVTELPRSIKTINPREIDLASFEGNLVLTNNPKHVKKIREAAS